MVEETAKFIRIDLNQFKLHLYLKPEVELTLHFDSQSRRFYLSVIGLVVHEMKKRGRITSIPLQEHLDVLALLNKTVGGEAGSSKKEHLLPRIYRKWKDALPDLGNAPLFKVVGRKKRYDELMDKVHGFSEGEKDIWANLFEYKGSHEHVRLRFSIDRLGASLDDVIIIYGEYPELVNVDAWEGFIAGLKEELEDKSRPERAYRELKEPESPLLQLRRWMRATPSRWQWPALCALIGLVVGAAAYAVWEYNLFAPQVEVASVEKMAFPLPDKPSIAVLPFRNLSDDPKQEYFVDGMTEDLITDLSKISGLFVIARNSVFRYKGKPVDVKKVSRELGVKHVLEGSVRKAGEQVRINAQLIDASTGRHLWAERYDGKMDDVFALQDRITQKIVTALAVKLTTSEQEQVARKGTDKIAAYDAFLKGWEHYRRRTPKDWAQAVSYFKRAIEFDPNYSRAYAALASLYYWSIRYWWFASLGIRDPSDAGKLVRQYTQMAMKNPTSHAYWNASQMSLQFHQHDKAIAEAERAIALDPNDPDSFILMAKVLIFAGRPEEAGGFVKNAMRLDPHYPAEYQFIHGLAYFAMGQLEEAVTLLESAVRWNPNVPLWGVALAVTYAHLGRDQEAHAMYDRIGYHHFSCIHCRWWWPFKDPEVADRFTDGIRKARMK